MLKSGFEESLESRLSASYPITSTTLSETGLEIFLAANSSYYVNVVAPVSSTGTSGARLGVYYSGTFATDNDTLALIRPIVSVLPTLVISAASVIEDTTPENLFYFAGSIRTSSAGRLYVKVAKNSGADDDFPLVAGACLVARAI